MAEMLRATPGAFPSDSSTVMDRKTADIDSRHYSHSLEAGYFSPSRNYQTWKVSSFHSQYPLSIILTRSRRNKNATVQVRLFEKAAPRMIYSRTLLRHCLLATHPQTKTRQDKTRMLTILIQQHHLIHELPLHSRALSRIHIRLLRLHL